MRAIRFNDMIIVLDNLLFAEKSKQAVYLAYLGRDSYITVNCETEEAAEALMRSIKLAMLAE